ncbi:type I-C CRISPR-associated protein Cas8c/Csd1 [Lactobacillus delbrueckii subsp. allosunkii]|uniref:type I-C CRISPR-associated protein Cas8c/Csd1 n=1 Tax=Lactobacillus delbrueckii TaxID=1584 RepID=UPI003A8B4ED4
MSWLSEFVDVYDKNEKNLGITSYRIYHPKSGEESKKAYQMLPVSHIFLNCTLQIDLNADGTFAGAFVVDDPKTIVPATIESSIRSGSGSYLVPLPVDDKLQYLARDYSKWSGDEKYIESHKKYLEQFRAYLSFLREYPDQYVYRTLQAVYRYVTENDIINDLWTGKIFGENVAKEKVAGNNLFKSTVRFNIRNPENVKRFENRRFFDAWTQYYHQVLQTDTVSGGTDEGIDYITGEENVILTSKHPKGILDNAANAKLISANDTTNFTFKGRFLTADEAVTIGYDSSQKAHAAMKWLLTKQGFKIGDRYYLAWEVNGENTADLSIVSQNPLLALAQKKFAETTEIDTNTNIAENFRKVLIDGANKDDYSLQGSVHLIELESPVNGRFGVVYYQAMSLQQYINKFASWYGKITIDDRQSFFNLKQVCYDIYGDRVDDKRMAATVSQLSHMILGSQIVPWSLLSAIYNRAIRPASFNDDKSWRRVTRTASKLFKAYYDEGEIKTMLNDSYHNRSYSFGRLLAIADVIEGGVLQGSENNEGRVTNAKRYMSSFAQRPLDTWKIIYTNLQPYLRKSKYSFKASKLIDEIFASLDAEDKHLNDPLNGKFLIGYSQQRNDWYQKKKTSNE